MDRIGLSGRIILILIGALLAVIVAALALGRYERAAAPQAVGSAYPRVEQAANVIDLLRRADPALHPTILKALNGGRLRVAIEDAVPPEDAPLRRAPRLEATLRAFADADLGEVRAYVDPEAPVPTRLQRAVWRMPDGRFLVIGEPEPPHVLVPRLFGLAPVIWIGLLGIAAAALGILGTAREMRPLRRLAADAAAFDGTAPAPPPTARGAPEIRRLAAAMHGMQERVAALLQERSFLIGAISHDLKTYLTRLRLRAENLEEGEARARMAADIEAMTELIETSLAFARGTTVARERGRVDLADLAAIEAAERDALGQEVALVGAEAADAVVAGDPVALRRVVTNLVDNAVKFGRARVELAVEAAPESCRLVVEDDGPGVTEAERAAIFSPFYRIEGSRSRRTGGSGLGLAIARQIVEAHGGTLAVEGGRLGGARFTVSLPRIARA